MGKDLEKSGRASRLQCQLDPCECWREACCEPWGKQKTPYRSRGHWQGLKSRSPTRGGHASQEWTCPTASALLSHWLRAAHEKHGLKANAAMDFRERRLGFLVNHISCRQRPERHIPKATLILG